MGRTEDQARRLLDDGVPHLRAQLSQENVRLILLNGRQVIDQVQSLELASLDRVARLSRGKGTCQLYVGAGEGDRVERQREQLEVAEGVAQTLAKDLRRHRRKASATPS